MSTPRRWTSDEEQVIISKVKANPNNLAKAFREASLELQGRTVCAITFHWYKSSTRQRALKDRCGHCFLLYGSRTLNINRKNVSAITSDNTITLTMDKVQQILEILLS